MKKVLLHDRVNQFPGQHPSVIIGNTMFALLAKKLFHERNAFCHPIVPCYCVAEHIKCDTNIIHFDTLSHRF